MSAIDIVGNRRRRGGMWRAAAGARAAKPAATLAKNQAQPGAAKSAAARQKQASRQKQAKTHRRESGHALA